MSAADDDPTGPEWDGHILLLHASESERRSRLTAWVRRGLDLGERVVYSERADVAEDRSVLTVLAERGVDVGAATSEGSLLVLPPQEFYMSAGYNGLIEDALADGFPGVRISGEDHAALTVLSESELAHGEHGLGRLCTVKPMSAMCQYPRCETRGTWLREIVAAHARVRQSQLRSDEHRRGAALTGEIDVANADIFAAALHAVTTSYERMVWLDLGGLRFLDVAACRALATVTQDFREGGGCVLLVAPQPSVERMLRLLDIDRLEGVEVVGSEP